LAFIHFTYLLITFASPRYTSFLAVLALAAAGWPTVVALKVIYQYRYILTAFTAPFHQRAAYFTFSHGVLTDYNKIHTIEKLT
jgi:hypothetical protein